MAKLQGKSSGLRQVLFIRFLWNASDWLPRFGSEREVRVIGRIRPDEKDPVEGQCIKGQQQFIYSTLIPCTSPATSAMYSVLGPFSTSKSSDLDWRDGMVWKPETQDVAAQPRPSSLHCFLRVGEVYQHARPAGKSPWRSPEMAELDQMGIPGRRVKGGGGNITSNVTRVDDRNLRHLAHQEQGKQAWNQKECATC